MNKSILTILFITTVFSFVNGQSNELQNFYKNDPIVEQRVDEIFNSLNDTTRIA